MKGMQIDFTVFALNRSDFIGDHSSCSNALFDASCRHGQRCLVHAVRRSGPDRMNPYNAAVWCEEESRFVSF